MVWNEREWITIKDYRYSRDVVLCCGSVLGVCECIRGWRVCMYTVTPSTDSVCSALKGWLLC